MPELTAPLDLAALAACIKQWSADAGFSETRITDLALGEHVDRLQNWIAAGHHGDMHYLRAHLEQRQDPQTLLPNARRAIVVRLDYLHDDGEPLRVLNDPSLAYISRYALGRDYHKLMRRRLARLAARIQQDVGPAGFRACVDSAPVLEKALAERAGLGWFGKHSVLINRSAGSWFFIGELLTDLDLPTDPPQQTEHCGSCTTCMDVCPTKAIIGPRELDARRCISYLTIENKGTIPEPLRDAIGNRIFGCDDCQLFCPWNRYAAVSQEAGFLPRHGLGSAQLADLAYWSEADFLRHTEGMALRRVSFEQWQRNLAVGLGNAPHSEAVVAALRYMRASSGPLAVEHIDWALNKLRQQSAAAITSGQEL